MRFLLASLAFSLGVSAVTLEKRHESFTLYAEGHVCGEVGQISDGQLRVGGGHPTAHFHWNGPHYHALLVDGHNRGCISTKPQNQFQCDLYNPGMHGFTVNSGYLSYHHCHDFWACPVNDCGEYNLYTQKLHGQDKCVPVKLVVKEHWNHHHKPCKPHPEPCKPHHEPCKPHHGPCKPHHVAEHKPHHEGCWRECHHDWKCYQACTVTKTEHHTKTACTTKTRHYETTATATVTKYRCEDYCHPHDWKCKHQCVVTKTQDYTTTMTHEVKATHTSTATVTDWKCIAKCHHDDWRCRNHCVHVKTITSTKTETTTATQTVTRHPRPTCDHHHEGHHHHRPTHYDGPSYHQYYPHGWKPHCHKPTNHTHHDGPNYRKCKHETHCQPEKCRKSELPEKGIESGKKHEKRAEVGELAERETPCIYVLSKEPEKKHDDHHHHHHDYSTPHHHHVPHHHVPHHHCVPEPCPPKHHGYNETEFRGCEEPKHHHHEHSGPWKWFMNVKENVFGKPKKECKPYEPHYHEHCHPHVPCHEPKPYYHPHVHHHEKPHVPEHHHHEKSHSECPVLLRYIPLLNKHCH